MADCTQAWTPVDSRATALGGTIAVTLPNTTSGQTLVGSVTYGNGADVVSSIVYSVGSTSMTKLVTGSDTSNNQSTTFFILKNITGGTAPTVTVTFSSNQTFRAISVHGVGNADTTTQPDVTSQVKWWSSSPGTGTDANNAGTQVTPTVNGCYIYSATGDTSLNSATHTAGTSYTRDTNGSSADVDYSSEHFIQTTAAAIHGRWTEDQANLFVTGVVVVRSTNTAGLTTEYVAPTVMQAGGRMIGATYV